jgi:hypothetical protein
MSDFTPISEYISPSPDDFHSKIRPLGQPAILRQVCMDWPLIKKAKKGPAALFSYLSAQETGRELQSLLAPPEVKGQFYYSENFRTQNFEYVPQTLSAALQDILRESAEIGAPSRYVQSVPMTDYMPSVIAENVMPYLKDVAPRAWIGGETTVQTHFDPSENIALVVMGERTATLFPPEQLSNLYPGPLETAPGGVFVSTANVEKPDFAKHPKFEKALSAALRGKLKAGDALYIPYGWWHHMQATAPLNMLINYWWSDSRPLTNNPKAALLHAIMAFHSLQPEERSVWQGVFEKFVFRPEDETPMSHLPEEARGMLGGLNEADRRAAAHQLLTVLGPILGLSPPPLS